MSYYRINTNLTIGDNIIKGNSIVDLHLKQSTIDRLLNSEAISIISTPPLEFMPLWEMRADKLKPLGINTGIELLNANSQFVAEQLNKTVELIDSWKQDLISDLIIPIERCCQ